MAHPYRWSAYHQIGWLLNKMNRLPETIEHYRRTIQYYSRLNPKDNGWFWSWEDLGECYYSIGKYGDALRAYQQAAAKDSPEWNAVRWQAWHNAGKAAQLLPNWTTAIEAYQNALRLNPQSPWSWFGLGHCHQHNNRFGLAWEAYHKAAQHGLDDSYVTQALQQLANDYQPWNELLDTISQRLDLDEIYDLCFAIGISHHDIPVTHAAPKRTN